MQPTLLMTVDELRELVAKRAIDLVERCETTDPATLASILWGARSVPGLSTSDRRRARQHRQFLDYLVRINFHREAADEIEGIASAYGLDSGLLEGSANSLANIA